VRKLQGFLLLVTGLSSTGAPRQSNFADVMYQPMTDDAPSAARGQITQRINRFLGGLERARRQPNRREAYHLRHALERLQAEQYAESEDALLRAERSAPLPEHVANLLATNESVTISQLRDELQKVVKAR
jgi:hypothetical protein